MGSGRSQDQAGKQFLVGRESLNHHAASGSFLQILCSSGSGDRSASQSRACVWKSPRRAQLSPSTSQQMLTRGCSSQTHALRAGRAAHGGRWGKRGRQMGVGSRALQQRTDAGSLEPPGSATSRGAHGRQQFGPCISISPCGDCIQLGRGSGASRLLGVLHTWGLQPAVHLSLRQRSPIPEPSSLLSGFFSPPWTAPSKAVCRLQPQPFGP